MKAGLRARGAGAGCAGIGSTGSPLPPEGFAWVHEALPDVQLGSFSGGTDVCTGFVGAVPLLPVRGGRDPLPLPGGARWSRSTRRASR